MLYVISVRYIAKTVFIIIRAVFKIDTKHNVGLGAVFIIFKWKVEINKH